LIKEYKITNPNAAKISRTKKYSKKNGLLEMPLNNIQKPVHWKFIDVSELHPLTELIDGAELYSRICEEEEADRYIKVTKQRASHILESSIHKSFPLN
jgi:hypothetical protein